MAFQISKTFNPLMHNFPKRPDTLWDIMHERVKIFSKNRVILSVVSQEGISGLFQFSSCKSSQAKKGNIHFLLVWSFIARHV